MRATAGVFAQWLFQAQIAEERLTASQRGLLQYAFAFRQRCGDDYYFSCMLSHFRLHCDSGLKVTQIARLREWSGLVKAPGSDGSPRRGEPLANAPQARPRRTVMPHC